MKDQQYGAVTFKIIEATKEAEIQQPAKARLFPALSWDCAACGYANFFRRDETGLPVVVGCRHCHNYYAVDAMG